MDSTIRIYKNPWDDVSEILSVLHPYLAKYTFLSSNDPRISKYIGEFPVFEFDGKRYSNPDALEVKKILGLATPPKIMYSDILIIGSGIEALLAMDYALKHKINVVGVGSIEKKAQERLDILYQSVLKIPTLFLAENFIDETPKEVSLTENRMYVKLTTEGHDYYSRGVFIAQTAYLREHGFTSKDPLVEKKIFYDTEGLFTRLLDKDLIVQKRRVVAVVGDDPMILRMALQLHQQLGHLRDGYTFDLLILSPRSFRKESKGMLSTLLHVRHVQVLDNTNITGLTLIENQVLIKTDKLSYRVDYILSYNEQKINSEFVENLSITDEYGSIETDTNNKTKYPNIYAMLEKRFLPSPEDRIGLLDQYLVCAQTIKQLYAYITGEEMF